MSSEPIDAPTALAESVAISISSEQGQAAVTWVTPLASPTCREFVANEDAMKQWPWFHKTENNRQIDAYDWLSELIAILLAALVVAAFVFVGDSWLRSQIGH